MPTKPDRIASRLRATMPVPANRDEIAEYDQGTESIMATTTHRRAFCLLATATCLAGMPAFQGIAFAQEGGI